MKIYCKYFHVILSGFGMFRAVITLVLLSTVLTGCATAVLIDDAFIGDPVELDFHVVHADLPNAMV